MALKQISLTLPENLLKRAKQYCDEYGYRNVQELLLELMRDRMTLKNIERYKKIEDKMEKNTVYDQKAAARHIKEAYGSAKNPKILSKKKLDEHIRKVFS